MDPMPLLLEQTPSEDELNTIMQPSASTASNSDGIDYDINK